MNKNLNYFFPDAYENKEETVEFVASNRFKDEDGEPIPWTFKLLDIKEINDVQKRSINFVNTKNGRRAETDMQRLKVDVILESLIYPNLKDVELQEAHNVMTPEELLFKLLEGREIERLSSKLMSSLGFTDDLDMMIGEAKN